MLQDGSRWPVFKRVFEPEALADELGGEVLHAGRWFVVVPFDDVSYRSLAALKRAQSVCRACVEAGYPLESLPVLAPGSGQRAYLFGQAPGVVEGEERRPWRGRAGKTLRRWLELDEAEFYATFYCASVTRCYPGRQASGRGDRTPSLAEQRLCEHWRDEELRLLKPNLVVTVGGLAARRSARCAQRRRERRCPLRAERHRRHPAPASVGCVELAQRARAPRASCGRRRIDSHRTGTTVTPGTLHG